MEARLGATMNCIPPDIVQYGLDGRAGLANHRCCQLTGYGEARLRTLTLHDPAHSEDRPRHPRQHARMLGTGKRSGGALVLRSQAGQDTTASLFLPQVRAPDGAPADPAAGDASASAATGPRRIMLVDDDAEVLEAMDEMLEASGYAVASFSSTASALSHLEHGEAADLLITDLSMPETDGLALIEEAQRRWPGVPSILLTGYNGDELAPATASLTGGRLVVLQKPIRLGTLLKQVAALLTGPGGRTA